jgi:hypothetical protein
MEEMLIFVALASGPGVEVPCGSERIAVPGVDGSGDRCNGGIEGENIPEGTFDEEKVPIDTPTSDGLKNILVCVFFLIILISFSIPLTLSTQSCNCW